MQYVTLVTAILGCCFGFLGAVLGVINTWRAIDRDRLRVKVTPIYGFNEAEQFIGIQVVNLSSFPVTITGIGFQGDFPNKGHIPVLNTDCKGCTIPARMEARTHITAFIPIEFCKHPNFARVTLAYAHTACGATITGNSDALRGHVKRMKAAAK